MRHVVQRGIKLAGKSRLALSGKPCVPIDALQTGCETSDCDEENETQQSKSEMIVSADEHQRGDQGSTGQNNLQMKNSRPAKCSSNASRHIGYHRGGAEHVGGGIVGPQQNGNGPNTKRQSVSDRTEPVSLLPNHCFGHGQRRIPLLVAIHLERTRQAHHHEEGHT